MLTTTIYVCVCIYYVHIQCVTKIMAVRNTNLIRVENNNLFVYMIYKSNIRLFKPYQTHVNKKKTLVIFTFATENL